MALSLRVVVQAFRLTRGDADIAPMSRLNQLGYRSTTVLRSIRELTRRHRQHLTREILQVRGLMPLLMKPRNNQRWTPEDKKELVMRLRRLSSISPYLMVLAMPGGMLMMLLLAWWIDRRRNRNRAGPALPRKEAEPK